MSSRAMKVYLRRNGANLASVTLTRGCASILVGRSHGCGLRAPADESSISGKHAQIFWKGAKLFIEDAGSRNGVFHAGEQSVPGKPMTALPSALIRDATSICQTCSSHGTMPPLR